MIRRIKKKKYFKEENLIIIKFFLLFLILFSQIYNQYKIPQLKKKEFVNYRISIDNKEKNIIFFTISNLTYLFSIKYNKIKIQYDINFHNNKKNLIKPSDLALFYELHIICHINSRDNLININILAYVFQNKNFNCIQYLSFREKNLKFGIKIYLKNIIIIEKYFLYDNIIDYNKLNYKKDELFDPLLINENYLILYKKMKEGENNKNLTNNIGLAKFYLAKPIFSNLISYSLKNNIWNFKNFFNNYFCFCKGSYCFNYNISKICKYRFYLNIIDNNKDLYEKTDFLFADFFFSSGSSDDAYPIFEEMIRLNISAHYMDEKISLYKKFCNQEKYCLKIIRVLNRNIFIDENFLEKYLDIILRLKAVIAGTEFLSFNNIFKEIDYITYINLGHGVKYFKSFLYEKYSSNKKYNKILLPPSYKIISLAKKYGWEDNNIIKICLPKWDKYDKYKEKIALYSNFKNEKSIFIMFTWRVMKKKNIISPYYLKNIIYLINNDKLKEALNKNNITLYFTLHHMIINYKKKIAINKITKFIEQNEISDCLTKTNLLVTDFSSIIFDMIYQRKPYIIFIPDLEDPNIKNIYIQGYYDIMNGLKNGSIDFQNKYLKLTEAINKILSYIKNDFLIDLNLSKFYDGFEFNCKNNTKSFINYLIKKK